MDFETYHNDIEDIATEILSECVTEAGIECRAFEEARMSKWTIYTRMLPLVLAYSNHRNAIEEHCDVSKLGADLDSLLLQAAQYAMYEDIMRAVRRISNEK